MLHSDVSHSLDMTHKQKNCAGLSLARFAIRHTRYTRPGAAKLADNKTAFCHSEPCVRNLYVFRCLAFARHDKKVPVILNEVKHLANRVPVILNEVKHLANRVPVMLNEVKHLANNQMSRVRST